MSQLGRRSHARRPWFLLGGSGVYAAQVSQSVAAHQHPGQTGDIDTGTTCGGCDKGCWGLCVGHGALLLPAPSLLFPAGGMGRWKTCQPERTRTGRKGARSDGFKDIDAPKHPRPCGRAALWQTRRPPQTDCWESQIIRGLKAIGDVKAGLLGPDLQSECRRLAASVFLVSPEDMLFCQRGERKPVWIAWADPGQFFDFSRGTRFAD